VGSVAKVTKAIHDSTSNRLRQPWDRGQDRPRKWPAYYDSTSQMLCQIVPQTATATIGTPNNNWKYHTAGIVTARRFITVPKTPPLSKIRGHRRTRLLSLFFLKHPSYPVLRSANVDRAMQDVVQSSIRVTFADYIATLPPWERDPRSQHRVPLSRLFSVRYPTRELTS
jgi:hypothetical protein